MTEVRYVPLSCAAMTAKAVDTTTSKTPQTPRKQLRSAEEIGLALDRGAPVHFVLCLEGACDPAVERVVERAAEMGISVRRVAERQLRRLLPHGTQSQVLALEGPGPGASLAEVMQRPEVVWMLVGCGYPGNVGYAIRSAEVSGAAGIVVASDFDRTERRDCLRYGMRVDRFFPVHFADAAESLALARAAGRTVVAVEDVGNDAPWQVDLSGPLLIVIGGEEAGIPNSVLAEADYVVRVPMNGFLPSFNLQAAMAIVMGERLRQTQPTTHTSRD